MIKKTLKTEGNNFWSEYLETMPRVKIEEMQLRRIQAIMYYAYENSAMYKKLYDSVGLKPQDIKTMEDFMEKVPFVDKKDFVAAQKTNPPFGDMLASEEILQRYMTSGSMGVPLQLAYLETTQIMTADNWSQAFWAVGIRPWDTFYIAFNFGTFVGFWAAYWGALNLGARIITGGGVTTQERIRQILLMEPTILISTPTYALHMAEVAKDMGVDLSKTSIRITYHAGEAGASIPTTRRTIEKAWGAKTYDFYGLSEVHGLAFHCPMQDRLHILEHQACCLVVDEKGNLVKNGEVGENIVTSFVQLAQPIIKYRTHDLVRMEKEKCPCGRTSAYLKGGILGRTDNMITIRGTNVYPSDLEGLLGEVEGTSENYEIHITREKGLDQINLKVEARRDLSKDKFAIVEKGIQDLCKTRIGVKISVEVLDPGTLPRYEMKSKKIFDHR